MIKRFLKEDSDNSPLQLTHRQVSHLIAALLLLAFFIFMAGFYWGKKSAYEPIAERLSDHSLSDRVYHAICCSPDSDEEEVLETEDENKPAEVETVLKDNNPTTKKFIARLVGFGTLRSATQCVQRLKKMGYAVVVAQRESVTARGRKITWYQVVTEPMADKEKLRGLVEKIQQSAQLKDIEIASLE